MPLEEAFAEVFQRAIEWNIPELHDFLLNIDFRFLDAKPFCNDLSDALQTTAARSNLLIVRQIDFIANTGKIFGKRLASTLTALML